MVLCRVHVEALSIFWFLLWALFKGSSRVGMPDLFLEP